MSIKNDFSDEEIKFLAVFAGPYYKDTTIIDFLNEYHLEMQGVLDPDYRLTKVVNATVTPEVILVSQSGRIAYSGAIDNWAYETGKKRPVVTHQFLRNAIVKLLNDSLPDPPETEPVGCFIEL